MEGYRLRLDGDRASTPFTIEGPASLYRSSRGDDRSFSRFRGPVGERFNAGSGAASPLQDSWRSPAISTSMIRVSWHIHIDGSKPGALCRSAGLISHSGSMERMIGPRLHRKGAVLDETLETKIRTANVVAPLSRRLRFPYQNHCCRLDPEPPKTHPSGRLGAPRGRFDGNTVGEDVACPGTPRLGRFRAASTRLGLRHGPASGSSRTAARRPSNICHTHPLCPVGKRFNADRRQGPANTSSEITVPTA